MNVTTLERIVLNIPLLDWLIALAIAVGATLALLLVRRVLVRRLTAYAARTATPLDDVIAEALVSTRRVFLLVLGLYLGLHYLPLPARAVTAVDRFMVLVLLLQLALWANGGVRAWLTRYLARKRETDAAAATTVALMGFVARLAVWGLTALLILDNLGFNITALVASLGIGGIAVALAVQNILGDIFSSLSIALDKPFVIGDFIIVDEVMGTVEYVGLKTTRIRSLSGEQIVFTNSDLLKSRIRNYKRMNERRVVFHFGVVYQTTAEQLARIPAMAREIIEQQDRTRFDRAHFFKYGDSSLDFEVVYHVLDRDYNLYMDIQQAINLALFRRFAAEGIDFAYPTRTLYVQGASLPGASS